MTLPLPVVIATPLILAAVGYALWRNHKTQTRRRAEYLALAELHGLEHALIPSRNRKPAEIRFTGGASGLSLVVTRPMTRKSGSSTTTVAGHTMLRLPDPRLDGGLALYTPELTEGLASAASKLMGIFDNSIARMILSKLVGDEIGAHLGELHEQPVPAGVGLTIMATVDPNPQFDASAIERAIRAAPAGRNAEAKTMVMINSAGLQIRVARALTEASDLERLIEVGHTLQADLRR